MKTIEKILKIAAVFLTIFAQTQLLFAAYCTSSGDSNHDIGIVSVTINSANQSSGISDYTHYTSSLLPFVPGATYSWEITYQNNTGDTIDAMCAVYIDYNGDDSFSDEACVLSCGTTSLPSGSTTVSGSFTIPAAALAGATRMRAVVINDARNYSSPYDCITGFDGETEDYDIIIVSSETHAISGHILDGAIGVENVVISFGGGITETSDSSGYYSHTVFENWIGVITPEKEGVTFSPYSATLGPITGDTVQNFNVAENHTISGAVTTAASDPVKDVSIRVGGFEVATTNSSGNYSFIIGDGWSGTVVPVKIGYGFSPVQKSYTNVTDDNTNQDYTGSILAGSHIISGRVTAGVSGVEGVIISGLPGNPITDIEGEYTAVVSNGWTGTAIPSKVGYEGSFNPSQTVYINVVSDKINQDYSISSVTVSGTITFSGTGLPGVVLSGLPGSISTDGSGNYTADVPEGWTGTITPQKESYYFTPASRHYNNITTSQPAQNFTANNAVLISGTVTLNGKAFQGVLLSGLPGSPVTDSSGVYTDYVTPGWSGTVTPQKEGTHFNPELRSYTNVISDYTKQDYSSGSNVSPINLLLLN